MGSGLTICGGSRTYLPDEALEFFTGLHMDLRFQLSVSSGILLHLFNLHLNPFFRRFSFEAGETFNRLKRVDFGTRFR